MLRGGHISEGPSYSDGEEVIEAMLEGDGSRRSGGSISIPSAEAGDDPAGPCHGGEGMGVLLARGPCLISGIDGGQGIDLAAVEGGGGRQIGPTVARLQELDGNGGRLCCHGY